MYNPYLYRGTYREHPNPFIERQYNYNSGVGYIQNNQPIPSNQFPFHPNYPHIAPYAEPFLQNMYPNNGGEFSSIEQLFDDPLYPLYNNQQQAVFQSNNGFLPYTNPPRPNNGMGYLLNSFKDANGDFDFNKMVNTAGQVAGVVNQVSSLLKGFTQMFKV